MRDVLSASLAGTALLSLSSSLVWPRQPQQRLLAMHPQRLWVHRHVVVGSACHRDRCCGLVFHPQADDTIGEANRP